VRLDWSKLLRPARLEDSGSAPTFEQKDKLHYNFEDDIQRILTCAAFRRLQGKTQVHPHPRNDYVRTRLTHSLEVAHFGRSLSRAIFPDLFSNFPNDFEFLSQNNQDSVRDHHHHFSDVVFAACLAHDIGNPPFGHMGTSKIDALT
jgi:dGTPase